jgi:hypothetical protein
MESAFNFAQLAPTLANAAESQNQMRKKKADKPSS